MTGPEIFAFGGILFLALLGVAVSVVADYLVRKKSKEPKDPS
jgi:hypothetical protein